MAAHQVAVNEERRFDFLEIHEFIRGVGLVDVTRSEDRAARNASAAGHCHERLSMVQNLDWAMPAGWYYKTMQNRAVWHAAEPYIRSIAGLGEVERGSTAVYEHAWKHAETAVIGGGYAGIQAALDAAERGAAVILVDDQHELGGQARYRPIANDRTGELIPRLRAQPNIQVLQGCYCFGMYEGNLLGVLQPRPHAKSAERLIHCARPNCGGSAPRSQGNW